MKNTIVFIFIFTTFRSICPRAFFRCLSNAGTFTELRTTSFIESTAVAWSDSVSTSVKYSCIVTHLQSRLNLQPPDDCLLRNLKKPTPITVTLRVLLDKSEWIFGTYKPNVLTWLVLLQLWMIFPVLIYIYIYILNYLIIYLVFYIYE